MPVSARWPNEPDAGNCDGKVVGSIERDHGWIGGTASCFRLANGEHVCFAIAAYQIDEERQPACLVDDPSWADAGYWVVEYFLNLPLGWLDRASELPGLAGRSARSRHRFGHLPGLITSKGHLNGTHNAMVAGYFSKRHRLMALAAHEFPAKPVTTRNKWPRNSRPEERQLRALPPND